ncbi:MAG: hypothetical protein Q4F72_10010, partial [Desulfovibrionaceae bacterium]|nr:hypothetical protein [Desulfovibrionaceae bacterium]
MKRTEEEAAAKGAAKRRGRPAKSGAGTAKTASKPASKGAAKTAGAKGAAQGSAKSAAKDTAKSTAKTGAVGRGRKPAAAQVPERVLWRPELDAAMPQGPELERLADRLLRDPKEVRAALAALVLTCSGDGTGDGANPAALPEEAAKRTEELRALCGEGSALAGLFCGVMHWHGQYLPRDIGAAARLLEKARQAG